MARHRTGLRVADANSRDVMRRGLPLPTYDVGAPRRAEGLGRPDEGGSWGRFTLKACSAYGALQMTFPALSNRTMDDSGRCSTEPVCVASCPTTTAAQAVRRAPGAPVARREAVPSPSLGVARGCRTPGGGPKRSRSCGRLGSRLAPEPGFW
jgi:hypothetical protein